MKEKMITAGFLAASMAMVAFISMAAGAPTISTIVISGPGVVWQFTPNSNYGEVTSVQAYYFLTETSPRENMPPPVKTIITDNLVTLIFSISDVGDLAGHVYKTAVEYYQTGNPMQPALIDGGPSFAWGRTR